jgi:hypothetical protein
MYLSGISKWALKSKKCTVLYIGTVARNTGMQSAKLFLQLSELGPPQPITRMRVCLPTLVPGGSTLACG